MGGFGIPARLPLFFSIGLILIDQDGFHPSNRGDQLGARHFDLRGGT